MNATKSSDLRLQQSVSRLTRSAYVLPGFALAVVGLPLYIYLPKFYTDTAGVDIAVMGYIILVARLFDGFSDPIIGHVSDRTRTRFGRRRPFMAIGGLGLGISLFLLYNPPRGSSDFVTGWFTVTILSTALFWTMVDVPWESLGPEITFDYDERTSLFSLREGIMLVGTLGAVALPTLISRFLGLDPVDDGLRLRYRWFTWIMVPVLWLLLAFCIHFVHERTQKAPKRFIPPGKWKQIFQNRPFVILLIAFVISSIGGGLPATLILYYVQYVLGSDQAELFLVIYFVTGIAFLPLWVKASSRIGKKAAWLSAMSLNTLTFIGVFFLRQGDVVLYGVLVFVSGLGFGATVALPAAMQADVLDYDELISGRRREGLYIGIWSIMKKFSSALGMGRQSANFGGDRLCSRCGTN